MYLDSRSTGVRPQFTLTSTMATTCATETEAIEAVDEEAVKDTIRREEFAAIELLKTLGYSEPAVEPHLWRRLMREASRVQFLNEPNRYQVRGMPVEHKLIHRTHFRNPKLANLFIVNMAAQHPSFDVVSIVQPVESLEDREVCLRHRTMMTPQGVAATSCALITIAAAYCGDYQGWRRESAADRRDATLPRKSQLSVKERRRMTFRAEYLGDVVLARLALAPYVCRWADADDLGTDTKGAKTAACSGRGHTIELEVIDGAPSLDQLRWLLAQMTDMHVAAESLDYTACYTGERIHYKYLERMTPPSAVLEEMRPVFRRVDELHDNLMLRFVGFTATLDAEFPVGDEDELADNEPS